MGKVTIKKELKEKIDEFEFIDKCLYFPEKKILVLGDLHIGYEESLNEAGVFAPRIQFKEIMRNLKGVLKQIKKIEKIVVLGDLKHEFGAISSQEWKEVKDILDFLKKKAKKVILIKGNHDTFLEPIAKRKELEIKAYFFEDGICFLHGHKVFPECLDKKIKVLVIGHRHPAVVLCDKYKKEKYKCFLTGKWKKKKIIILPSFFPFVEGSDIVTNYKNNKLFIHERDLRNFDVYVVGEKIYRFGKLKSII